MTEFHEIIYHYDSFFTLITIMYVLPWLIDMLRKFDVYSNYDSENRLDNDQTYGLFT